MERRAFLTTAGGLAVGVGVGRLTSAGTAYAADTLPALPWGPIYYPKAGLNPETVRQAGYCIYYREGGCGQGSAQALIDCLGSALALENPTINPWLLLPRGLYAFGAGGAIGWGTICGALNGTLGVLDILGVHNQLGHAVMDYCSNAVLPTTKLVGYTPPAGVPVPLAYVPTNIAGSPLCHVALSSWAAAAGVPVADPSKRDRCAKVVGDVVAYAAELLNDKFLNNITPAAWVPPANYAGCYTCHTQASMVPSEQGRMDCSQCHSVTPKHPAGGTRQRIGVNGR